MKKIVLTLCLFAMTFTAYSNSETSTTQTTITEQQGPRHDNDKDSRKRTPDYRKDYEKQEAEVKKLYRELGSERHNSRRYTDLKREFNDAQTELREIRVRAKRDDVRISASKWETVRVK